MRNDCNFVERELSIERRVSNGRSWAIDNLGPLNIKKDQRHRSWSFAVVSQLRGSSLKLT